MIIPTLINTVGSFLSRLDRLWDLNQARQPEHVQDPDGQPRWRPKRQLAAAAIQQLLSDSQDPKGSGINERHIGQVDDHIADPQGDNSGQNAAQERSSGDVCFAPQHDDGTRAL